MSLLIYTKSLCPNCTNAKTYLSTLDIDFDEVNIEEDPTARDFLLKEGHKSVPQFYWRDNLLIKGGWSLLKNMSKQQILDSIDSVAALSRIE